MQACRASTQKRERHRSVCATGACTVLLAVCATGAAAQHFLNDWAEHELITTCSRWRCGTASWRQWRCSCSTSSTARSRASVVASSDSTMRCCECVTDSGCRAPAGAPQYRRTVCTVCRQRVEHVRNPLQKQLQTERKGKILPAAPLRGLPTGRGGRLYPSQNHIL